MALEPPKKLVSENESNKLQPGLLQEPDPGRDEGQQRRRRGRRRRRRPPGSQTQNDSQLHQGAFEQIVEGQVLQFFLNIYGRVQSDLCHWIQRNIILGPGHLGFEQYLAATNIILLNASQTTEFIFRTLCSQTG